ncbi:MAG: glycosyl hydrolase [Cyclobacteriaceae bacterium]|nr:glycosyl hydrolase [Cyclobacteriaceae bacterium]
MRSIILFLLSSLCLSVYGQSSTEAEIQASFEARKKLAEQSILRNYPARNIGPTVQGGRIVDIEVNLKNTHEYYLGFASGGIFKTENNGITFQPIFDDVDAMGIGDFALSQTDPKTLYVGTGEKNSSRSSYAGSGMYKTTDAGKTWQHLGLTGTHHISRVLIHPQDNSTVWVAAIGALYSKNVERGVFKTTDGGKTWKKTLFVNDSTGIIDLVINPSNPNQLLASSWDRSRKAWDFKEGGEGSSIYKSDDGGETWYKSLAGFPQGAQIGRIGLDVSTSNPSVVYAILDNQGEIPQTEKPKDDGSLKADSFKDMTKENFQKLDDKKLDEFFRSNRFPQKYDAKRVKKEISDGKYTPAALYDYLGGDANANLFNKKIIGAEVYRSDDNGTTWKKMNSYDLDGVFFTYGYYFAEMRVDPSNADKVYIYGVPLLKSNDGGVTWNHLDTLRGEQNIHVDHHALWVNPNNGKHMLLGNDGGLYVTYDEGAYWQHINNMPVGQFYTVNVDMETPYNVYGGLQDNGVLKGSSRSVPNVSKHWETIGGGDGMYVAADPRNSKLVYWGFQFGNYFRVEPGKPGARITPRNDIGEPAYRWNWCTPLQLSKHNPDIVYMAAQKVFRSLNKGETWESISDDLTKNKKQGDVPFSTISALEESPLKFGLLYAGTDDGNVWVSKNSGGSWESIVTGLPQNKWVSSLSPSPHAEGTVYVSLNGYRDDDFKTYLYVSTDYGKNWKSVKGNLPESVANVIVQDPVQPNLLYCGLDNGTYASLDNGTTWHYFNGMLNVASYDMLVHPRDNELVVGTHGRSVFVSDVKPLQALKDAGKSIMAFTPESIRHSERWGQKQYPWAETNEPKVNVLYYVGKAAPTVTAEVYDEKKNLVRKLTASGSAGFQTFTWDVKVNEVAAAPAKGKGKSKAPAPTEPTLKYAEKGKYTIKFVNGGDSSEVVVEIR